MLRDKAHLPKRCHINLSKGLLSNIFMYLTHVSPVSLVPVLCAIHIIPVPSENFVTQQETLVSHICFGLLYIYAITNYRRCYKWLNYQ